MSKLDKMIKELCPDGVENVKLVDVAYILYGCPFDATLFSEDDSFIPLIRIRDVVTGIPSTYYSGEYSEQFIIHKGDILVGMDGNFNLGRWNDRDGVLCQRTCKIESKDEEIVVNNYLFHLLGPIFKVIEDNTPGGSVKHLSAKVINAIEIPLPPLPIQQKIVSVLDSFTTLIDKMKQEVEKRKKQMEYYREKQLSPKADCEVKTLGEIGTFTRGNGLQKTDFTEDGYPCIHYGQIHTYYGTSTYSTKSFCEEEFAKRLRKAKTGDLLIATTSEDVEACCKATVWLGEGEVAFSGDSYCYSHNQNPKYIAYLFQTEMFAKQKRMVAKGAKVVRVTGESMENFSFAFPSLSKQSEIVSTLDKFESYITKLEKMIVLRQKQYEYYREQLLTFRPIPSLQE